MNIEAPAIPAAQIPKDQRQITIDKEFQYFYFRICFWTGLVVIGMAVLIYVAARLYIGVNDDLPSSILMIIIGLITFVILFCGMIGFITLRMTHKVVAATIGLKRSIDRLRERRLEEKVRVRRGDYLRNLAEALDGLRNAQIWQRGQITTLHENLQEIRKSIPAGASLAVDQALQCTQALLYPKASDRRD